MRVRTKLLAVIIVVNLAILLAGLVILPSLRADRDIEAALTGRANRISMSVILQRALSDMDAEAKAISLAAEAGPVPLLLVARLREAHSILINQLKFLPVGDDPALAELRRYMGAGAGQIDALLATPIDVRSAAELARMTGEIRDRAQRQLLTQLQRDNLRGLGDATAEFSRLRHRLAIALGAVACTLLLSIGLSLFAYRRLVRPLGAVTDNLGAVLTGRRADARLVETNDEFGDIVRAMRRIEAQAEHIRRIAYVDAGSRLPNRNSLDADLREVRRLRPIDGSHGLLLIGIATYAAVRSGFGMRLAEAMLSAAGERLANLDSLPTQTYRIDSDVLAVLVDRGSLEAVTRAELKRVAAEALSRLAHPVEVDEQTLKLSVAAGAAIYPDDARDPEEYINVALEALQRARTEGQGTLQFGERGHTHRLRRHLALTEQIRAGIRHGQFVPYFQPIVDVARRKVIGAETLVRWRQPDGRVTMPGEFIFVAEGSDLIAGMTREVLQRACTVFKALNDRGADLQLSFNLSTKLLSTNVMEIVREALQSSGLEPARITAEVTETALMRNLDHASHVLQDLRALGVRLSLDDFGTGYSSLAHLYRFDVSGIKIDPVLTSAAGKNHRVQEIIRSMAVLAASIDISLTIEGVESEDDVRLMQKLGARTMQGFHFSRALPEEQFIEWVRTFEAGIRAA